LKAETNSVTFNEKFQMKTSLDYNVELNQFVGKKSVLALQTKDGAQLGESYLDLAKYANDQSIKKDRLVLEKSSDPKAYIEISIVAKPEEPTDNSSAMRSETTMFTKRGMDTIQESQNETEVKFELEKKEKELQTQLENLKNQLAQLT